MTHNMYTLTLPWGYLQLPRTQYVPIFLQFDGLWRKFVRYDYSCLVYFENVPEVQLSIPAVLRSHVCMGEQRCQISYCRRLCGISTLCTLVPRGSKHDSSTDHLYVWRCWRWFIVDDLCAVELRKQPKEITDIIIWLWLVYKINMKYKFEITLNIVYNLYYFIELQFYTTIIQYLNSNESLAIHSDLKLSFK